MTKSFINSLLFLSLFLAETGITIETELQKQQGNTVAGALNQSAPATPSWRKKSMLQMLKEEGAPKNRLAATKNIKSEAVAAAKLQNKIEPKGPNDQLGAPLEANSAQKTANKELEDSPDSRSEGEGNIAQKGDLKPEFNDKEKPLASLKSKVETQAESPDSSTEAKKEKGTTPWDNGGSDGELLRVNLEDIDLKSFMDYVAKLFHIRFLPDDAVNPMGPGGKGTAGVKITFRTNEPLTRSQVWNLFGALLDLSGLTIVQAPQKGLYRVMASQEANKSPLPSYIGTDPNKLPEGDIKIRFVYFITNSTVEIIGNVIDKLRSGTSTLIKLPDLGAILLTDKASNIKSLMRIVTEIDSPSIPETLSVLKLERTDAEDVKKLYDELVKAEEPKGIAARLFGGKRGPTALRFTSETKVIVEARTNSLIIMGKKDNVSKLEEFITEEIDKTADKSKQTVYITELEYANAQELAKILTSVTKFAPNSEASKSGGVRDGEKYFSGVGITADEASNRLIIRADHEDYLKIQGIIKKLDAMQPQVVIETLILTVSTRDTREMGSQIRNKSHSQFFPNTNFQTSGFGEGTSGSGPLINKDTGSIFTTLAPLLSGRTAGNFLVSLGNVTDMWAVFRALKTFSQTNILATPFITATNRYTATTSLGESRRVVSAEIVGSTQDQTKVSYTTMSADLKLQVTPQINSDGVINLDIGVSVESFMEGSQADKESSCLTTKASVMNKEVLVLGGMTRKTLTHSETKVPILGDIPLLGWLFKNKHSDKVTSTLLIFMCPQIVYPDRPRGGNIYTANKIDYIKEVLAEKPTTGMATDPIEKHFFKCQKEKLISEIDKFAVGKYRLSQLEDRESPSSDILSEMVEANNGSEEKKETKDGDE